MYSATNKYRFCTEPQFGSILIIDLDVDTDILTGNAI